MNGFKAKTGATLAAVVLAAFAFAASAQMMNYEPDMPAGPAVKAAGAATTVTGKIVALDATKRTLDLEDGKTYVLPPTADLNALKLGDRVKVEYTLVANFNVVASITAVN